MLLEKKKVILLEIFLISDFEIIRAYDLITINLFRYINLSCKMCGLGSRYVVCQHRAMNKIHEKAIYFLLQIIPIIL